MGVMDKGIALMFKELTEPPASAAILGAGWRIGQRSSATRAPDRLPTAGAGRIIRPALSDSHQLLEAPKR
jgi:hypothetical protein